MAKIKVKHVGKIKVKHKGKINVHHTGNIGAQHTGDVVKVHSLLNPITWIWLIVTGFLIVPYWIVSPRHVIRLI